MSLEITTVSVVIKSSYTRSQLSLLNLLVHLLVLLLVHLLVLLNLLVHLLVHLLIVLLLLNLLVHLLVLTHACIYDAAEISSRTDARTRRF